MEEPQLFLTVTKEALAAAARASMAVVEAYILADGLIGEFVRKVIGRLVELLCC